MFVIKPVQIRRTRIKNVCGLLVELDMHDTFSEQNKVGLGQTQTKAV